ncbi:nitroreductase family protein [Amphibiibacter pelophylacis]|uniref:Nitroreductase family protein n=1 Tax=Amphibiibacter pelophylacis TaxID=1799477 RepID=A0ACC6P619_9BURK
MNPKLPTPDHDILPVLSQRWSPYAWASTPVADADLYALFEAARWAPSAFNEQPWQFVVARQGDDLHATLLDCLVEPNRVWAQNAPVLVLNLVRQSLAATGQPNRCAEHDLGLAVGNLLAQATHLGLSAHQMAGILPDVARERLALPEGTVAVTAMVIGYAGQASSLPEALAARDTAPRQRKPIDQFVSGAVGAAR